MEMAQRAQAEEPAHEKEFSSRQVLGLSILGLSLFSVLGESLRVFLGDLWGTQCRDKDGSWLYHVVESLNLCVTSSGSDGTQGGAVFADLPANMLGCFLMGFLQPGQDLGLNAAPMPMAFLSARHPFQRTHIYHLGLRTGFCGALTTLASWNTQMVIMMYGGTVLPRPNTQLFSALLGYTLGLEAAMASLVCGQTVAIWMHRATNADLAEAEDLALASQKSPSSLQHASQRRSSIGRINASLPDFERRYLDGFVTEEEVEATRINAVALEALERWKQTTEAHRHQPVVSSSSQARKRRSSLVDSIREGRNNRHLQQILTAVERRILVDKETPASVLVDIARDNGWDMDALQAYAAMEIEEHTYDALTAAVDPKRVRRFAYVFGSIMGVMALGLIVAFGYYSLHGNYTSNYRSVFWSALLAPPGTLVRWQLAALNGKWKRFKWFPLGTFLANMLACVVSILMAGILQHYPINKWEGALLSAIKTGFAGSLSTVSTFVVEGDRLRKTYPHHAKAYFYMIGSLVTACLMGLVVFVPMALTAQR